MKLIDKDALVAEIESRIKSMEECFNGKFPMSQSVKETEQDKGKLVAYKSILSFIDTLPSKVEPKKCMFTQDHFTEEDRKVLCEDCDEDCEYAKKVEPAEIDFEKELYKAFGQVKDFTLGMRIAKWFYDMGKNSQDPVSEDLEEAAKVYEQTRNDLDVVSDNQMVERAFKSGAKWQEQQDQSTIELAEDHAMFAGMEKMKEQMMKDAVDGVVEYKYSRSGKNLFDVGSRVLLDAAKYHVDDGGKVKLIIIKED